MAEQLLVTMSEAARMLGISRSRAYELAATSAMPGLVRIGRSVRVSVKRLEEWVERQTALDVDDRDRAS